ncbi:class I SAM-dependent methyltransferase [Flavisolibacter ginsengisoli]|jgi:2-polyprenyl-3-methyl-5-hydroxy-6-metoxy-1,4-benzoquinol methylase|uniref:2-polyprenyl-3-methyl-5-hydroxy-6-metoxy-1,4-benzoquinol methylase n=1 Tax=Flavisolibacter ginsengisoli DSM 18119 TaxID=1121884 RepID=A0A1M5ADC2_9BACT|nr:class I SAM-dependent methyltransferase [Flavisolibacter ginsengisoli]SHF27912.1 2-polyprenyl-3-methyl-5-hydroxy-6-metoxy-1,4-benzoquinol methylase [Flavisolibacter ginsengisoli DSM 18119]
MSKLHYTHCPVCGSSDIHPILTAKDHSVSGEDFVIWQCQSCTLRFTQDVPDENSIGPYYQSQDYISHSNTNKGLLNKLYQAVRKFTLGQKSGLVISHTTQKGRILDIGAGIGAFLNEMKQKGWDIEGVEPDYGARQQARNLFAIDLKPTPELNQLPHGSYDAITLWHVLEHVEPLQDYVAQLKKLLTPNGRIFIAVPNYTSLDADLYGNRWAAYDVPRHLYHFTPRSIEVLVEKHGMKIIGRKPMWFDAFYISLLSSKYRTGNTSWLGAGINGIRSNFKALVNKKKASSLIYIISKN